jgi:hypothetical protein
MKCLKCGGTRGHGYMMDQSPTEELKGLSRKQCSESLGLFDFSDPVVSVRCEKCDGYMEEEGYYELRKKMEE